MRGRKNIYEFRYNCPYLCKSYLVSMIIMEVIDNQANINFAINEIKHYCDRGLKNEGLHDYTCICCGR